jgi:hypothetical protein
MLMPADRAAACYVICCEMCHCPLVARIRIAVSEISAVMSEPHVVAWP